MKRINQFSLVLHLLKGFIAISIVLACGAAIGQDEDEDEFMLEEITVTALFQETDLQKTPISITAVSGEKLELMNIVSVQDLGLIIPNSQIRMQDNFWGPNAYIGMRGVDQGDFIPTNEPGVVVYVDDIFNETVVGSTMDFVDLERVEVLRGPQGTLFGKNAIGGAIRLFSKTPQGDNTGHVQLTYGDYDRLDLSASYDFTLIKDTLFARVSGSSKRIDGYVDRLDFRCQMEANGTPELAGDFPSYMRNYELYEGHCKVGEKGGSHSDGGKLLLRWLPADKLEVNFGVDYTEMLKDTGPETLIRGINPDTDPTSADSFVDALYRDKYGVSILGDRVVTGDPFTVFETFVDPIKDIRWPDKINEYYKNLFARVDYDVTDDIHAKFIFGYREYQQIFPTVNSQPWSFNAYFIDLYHDQFSYELRLTGTAFHEQLDWTAGAYYYKTFTDYQGYVTFGTAGIMLEELGLDYILPFGFNFNDKFDNNSTSLFAHGVYAITDKLSLTAGIRMTDESKELTFNHTALLSLDEPLTYGGTHYDWKGSLQYQFTDDVMAYFTTATGFRSEGTNSRPYNASQVQDTPDEELLMYEVGTRTEWLDGRLRVNASVFYNIYDPRVAAVNGYQCTDPNGTDPGEPVFVAGTCPADSWSAINGIDNYWVVYLNAPGKSKGVELDIAARPVPNLNLTATLGYYNYETDVSPENLGYIHPDYDLQADWSGSASAQYRIAFGNGSMLVPRMDMFYQGERSNGAIDKKPIPGNVTPDYTLFNGRLTYMSSDGKWTLSLEAQNLFDKFYWVNYPATRQYGAGGGIENAYGTYGLQAQPGRPRTLALTFRYNIF